MEQYSQLMPDRNLENEKLEQVMEEIKQQSEQTLGRNIIHNNCLEHNFKIVSHTIDNIDRLHEKKEKEENVTSEHVNSLIKDAKSE